MNYTQPHKHTPHQCGVRFRYYRKYRWHDPVPSTRYFFVGTFGTQNRRFLTWNVRKLPKKAKKPTFFDLGFAIFAQKVLSMVPKSYILYLAKEKMKLPHIGYVIYSIFYWLKIAFSLVPKSTESTGDLTFEYRSTGDPDFPVNTPP